MSNRIHQLWSRTRIAVARSRITALGGALALIAAVLLTGTAAGTAGAATSRPQVVGNGWECTWTPIPPGYVVSDTQPLGCQGTGMTFRQPEFDGVWACVGSPVGPGYVLTNWAPSGCRGEGSYQHQIARDGLWVCQYSRIPPGYYHTDFAQTLCGGVGAFILRKY
ncbi:hypothetical protein [Kitasatospora sp. NPDC094011]|uniref:hypothetical protein n=1 Tax=Kitasatospora sp. NPDC094011 TaxID=3364090 RepID=UPI0037FBA09A